MKRAVKLTVAVATHVVLVAPLVAQERTWLCDRRDLTAWPASKPAMEMKQPGELPGVGEVYVRRLNIRNRAWVSTEGLSLRWDWGSKDGGNFRYSFVIDANAEGRFFDFNFTEDEEEDGVEEEEDGGSARARPRMLFSWCTTCSELVRHRTAAGFSADICGLTRGDVEATREAGRSVGTTGRRDDGM